MNTIPRHRFARALLGLAPLLCAPAFAGTNVLAGVSCISDGAVAHSTNGALANAEVGSSSTTKFHCPAPRTHSLGGVLPYAVTVRLNVLRNLSGTDWNCAFRTVDKTGLVIASQAGYVAPWNGTGSRAYTLTMSNILVDAVASRSYSLRCNVPDVAGNQQAAIVSYEIID